MDLREDDGGDEIEIQNQLRRDKEEDVLNLILIDWNRKICYDKLCLCIPLFDLSFSISLRNTR